MHAKALVEDVVVHAVDGGSSLGAVLLQPWPSSPCLWLGPALPCTRPRGGSGGQSHWPRARPAPWASSTSSTATLAMDNS
jgi:hypothetical protein